MTAGIARHRLLSSSLGTAGYVISSAWAKRLLADPSIDFYAIDRFLFGRDAGNLYRGRIYQAVPALVVPMPETQSHGVGRSDLTPERRVASHKRPGRTQKLVYQLGQHWRLLAAFGPSGALWGARQLRIPPARDLADRL